MTLKDELDYTKEKHSDLVVRMMGAQAYAQFLDGAYDVLRAYGIDFKKLPEWKAMGAAIDAARKLKPDAALPVIIEIFTRLENALMAAVRRQRLKVIK